MPTRRQLLGGSAAGIGGRVLLAGGAAAALSSCTLPKAVAPRRFATAYRTLNGYRRDLVLWDIHGKNLTNIVQNVFGRAGWFPDGLHVCIARGAGDDSRGTWALWLCHVDGTLLHPITNPAFGVADLDPCIGTDGQTIVFSRDTIGFGAGQGIWIVQASGQGLHPVPGAAGGISPSFSHDLKFIVYAAADGIRRIPTAGGTPTLIAHAAFGWQFTQPTWSLTNNRVAFVRRDSAAAASLCYVTGTGGKITVLTSSTGGIECPTWGTDGATVNYARFNGYGAEGRSATDVYGVVIGGLDVKIFRPSGAPATDLSTLP
jgi:Tol biopolymer transport system component